MLHYAVTHSVQRAQERTYNNEDANTKKTLEDEEIKG